MTGTPTTAAAQALLVQRAAAGDHDAFAELAGAAYRRLYGIARLMLGDPELAEDAVQEALVRAWRDLPTLRHADAWGSWLHRIVVRACLTEARRRGATRAVPVDAVTPALVPATPDETLAVQRREELHRAFAALSVEQRTVVILHHYLDLPLHEIGETLGLPVGTVKSRLHYALQTMRATLEADARMPGGSAR
jgi:RNA polymerase sigma-70 factor (ECF subfamily)